MISASFLGLNFGKLVSERFFIVREAGHAGPGVVVGRAEDAEDLEYLVDLAVALEQGLPGKHLGFLGDRTCSRWTRCRRSGCKFSVRGGSRGPGTRA